MPFGIYFLVPALLVFFTPNNLPYVFFTRPLLVVLTLSGDEDATLESIQSNLQKSFLNVNSIFLLDLD